MDIYKGFNNRRTYFVGEDPAEVLKAAKQKMKKSSSEYVKKTGYVVGDRLYLHNPEMKNQKRVYVVCTK